MKSSLNSALKKYIHVPVQLKCPTRFRHEYLSITRSWAVSIILLPTVVCLHTHTRLVPLSMPFIRYKNMSSPAQKKRLCKSCVSEWLCVVCLLSLSQSWSKRRKNSWDSRPTYLRKSSALFHIILCTSEIRERDWNRLTRATPVQ